MPPQLRLERGPEGRPCLAVEGGCPKGARMRSQPRRRGCAPPTTWGGGPRESLVGRTGAQGGESAPPARMAVISSIEGARRRGDTALSFGRSWRRRSLADPEVRGKRRNAVCGGAPAARRPNARLEELISTLAARLRGVHRDVGVTQHLALVLGSAREEGYTDARSDPNPGVDD